MTTNHTRPFCRRWILGVAIAAACGLMPQGASAHLDGDVRAGVNVDANYTTLGGGVLLDIDRRGDWYFNPNMETGLSDFGDRLSMNGDFHFDLQSIGDTSFYLGGGPALLSRRGYSGFGLNLLAGMAGRRGQVRPFAQLKGVLADSGELILMGGVRF